MEGAEVLVVVAEVLVEGAEVLVVGLEVLAGARACREGCRRLLLLELRLPLSCSRCPRRSRSRSRLRLRPCVRLLLSSRRRSVLLLRLSSRRRSVLLLRLLPRRSRARRRSLRSSRMSSRVSFIFLKTVSEGPGAAVGCMTCSKGIVRGAKAPGPSDGCQLWLDPCHGWFWYCQEVSGTLTNRLRRVWGLTELVVRGTSCMSFRG